MKYNTIFPKRIFLFYLSCLKSPPVTLTKIDMVKYKLVAMQHCINHKICVFNK